MRWDIGLGEDPQYDHANWIWNILKSASSKVTTAHTCIIFFSEFLTLRRNQLEFEKLSLFECQIFEIRSNISHFSEVSGKYQIIFGNKLIQGLEREEGYVEGWIFEDKEAQVVGNCVDAYNNVRAAWKRHSHFVTSSDPSSSSSPSLSTTKGSSANIDNL